MAETELEKLEGKLHEHKAVREEHESTASNSESLQRKIALLESELDTAEKNLKETTDKYVFDTELRIARSNLIIDLFFFLLSDCDRWTSRLNTLSAK